MKRAQSASLGILGAVPLALAIGANLQTPTPTATDPVASLMRDVAAGKVKLTHDKQWGYLPALLKTLNIDPASQTLVFSKTSLQSRYITRQNPRAIYFNDHTYVGFIPGAPLLEIMSVHPTKGARFYTLPNTPKPVPQIRTESAECTRCHGGNAGTPASLFAETVFAAPSGYPRIESVRYDSTPDLPLKLRWGGWYVTGTHGKQRHLGNEPAEGTDTKYSVNTARGANVTDLRRYFDTSRYLTPHSDIVALMVMEHQMAVQNALSTASITFAQLAPTDKMGISEVAEAAVQALLSSDEVRLSGPITGTSNFKQAFEATAPKDPSGRSLSQIDLKTRTLRYACSPLIYSPTFAAMPTHGKAAVLKRLKAILTAPNAPADRKATHEILLATLPDYRD